MKIAEFLANNPGFTFNIYIGISILVFIGLLLGCIYLVMNIIKTARELKKTK